MLKLLIDECLTLDLVEVARRLGHPESSHVVWVGKAGWKDWELKRLILEEDWTFVTRNSDDFRGDADEPGNEGQYAGLALHAGLICINGPVGITAEDECELLEAALREIGDTDLVNEVVEITLQDAEGEYEIRRYSLPAPPGE